MLINRKKFIAAPIRGQPVQRTDLDAPFNRAKSSVNKTSIKRVIIGNSPISDLPKNFVPKN